MKAAIASASRPPNGSLASLVPAEIVFVADVMAVAPSKMGWRLR